MPNDRSRFAKAGAAVLDQGLSSVASFAASVAVAARLSVADHGRFAFAIAVMGLLLGLHQAVIVEPALMHGQGRFRNEPEAHRTEVWRLHAKLMVVIALLMAVVGGFGATFGGREAMNLAVLALVAPAWLTLNLARRLEFVALRPERAAQRAGLFAVAVGLALGWLMAVQRLTPTSALLALGGAALLVVLLDVRRIRPEPTEADMRSEVVGAHRDHAGWAMGATVARWMPLHGAAFLLPMMTEDGFFHAGTLRTHLLLALPMLQAMSAIGSLSTSVYARRRAEGQPLGLTKSVVGWTTLALGYAALLVGFGGVALTALSSTPTHLSWRLAMGIVVVVQAPASLLAGWLLARSQSRRLFFAAAGAAIFSLVATLVLLSRAPADGAFAAVALAYGAALVGMVVASLVTGRGSTPS